MARALGVWLAALLLFLALSVWTPRWVFGQTTFVCTEIIGYSQTAQWAPWAAIAINNGGIDRVQVRTRNGGDAADIANPNDPIWSQAPVSPCASSSAAPDRVILDVTHPLYLTMADPVGYSEAIIRAAVATIRQKYPAVQSVVLQPVFGGPNHAPCPWAGAEQGVVRASFNHPAIHAAILRVGGMGYDSMLTTCADYQDSIGHINNGPSYGTAIGTWYRLGQLPTSTLLPTPTLAPTPTVTPTPASCP